MRHALRGVGIALRVPDTAIVLAAGHATRLRPLSCDRAKAAVPIAGEALARRILRWLAAAGIRRLVLNLHHLPETITREIGDGSDLGASVRYSWEPTVLGTAGGPRHALPLIDADPFWIVNGDTLTDVNLGEMWRRHVDARARVTMALVANPDPAWYGGVRVDDAGRVTGFPPAGASPPGLHFIGVQIASREVFDLVRVDRPSGTVGHVYPELLARSPGAIAAFESDASFRDVGTPADYLDTVLAIAREEGGTTKLAGRGARVDPSARLIDCVLWDEVEVEARAELTRSVVGDGVRVPAGSRFSDCAIVRAAGRLPAEGETIVGDLLVAPLAAKGDGARR